MFEFERIAEKRIAEAVARGDLDNLSGQGSPLNLDDDVFIPAEKRLAYRILKNAGFAPEEIRLRRQIFDLEQTLVRTLGEVDKLCAIKRLDFLRAKLAARRGYETDYQMQAAYHQKLLCSFSVGRSKESNEPARPRNGERR